MTGIGKKWENKKEEKWQYFASVVQDFATIGQDFATIGQDFATIKQDFASVGQDFATIEQDFATVNKILQVFNIASYSATIIFYLCDRYGYSTCLLIKTINTKLCKKVYVYD